MLLIRLRGNQMHFTVITEAVSTVIHSRSGQNHRDGQSTRKEDTYFSFKKITFKARGSSETYAQLNTLVSALSKNIFTGFEVFCRPSLS